MNEIKLANQPATDTSRDQQPVPAVNPQEIRPLQDLELALAGGGDGVVTWP